MKTVPLRDAKQQFSEYVVRAQKEHVLVTKHGRPSAIIWGVEGHDLEDVVYMTDPSFWRMVRKRRSQTAIPWAKAKKSLRS